MTFAPPPGTTPVSTKAPGGYFGGGYAPPAKTGPPSTGPVPPLGTAQMSARSIIMNFLNQYGLGSLANWAWSRYLALGGGDDAINEIQFELPDQQAFKTRFPAYAALAKAGHVMSPADMISLENSYSQALHSAGLPNGFYDSPNDFAAFMLNNVSPSEVAQRAQLAASLVLGDPEAAKQAAEFGIPSSHQVAWILDPTRALPIIQNTVLAAQDAATAAETGFGQLTRQQALTLGTAGVSVSQARQGFNQLGTEAGLMNGTTAEGTGISQQDQVDATFLGNAQAQLRIQNRQAQRLADYRGGAGFGVTQKGTTGLGEQQ